MAIPPESDVTTPLQSTPPAFVVRARSPRIPAALRPRKPTGASPSSPSPFFSMTECGSRGPPASVVQVAYPATGAQCIGQVAISRGHITIPPSNAPQDFHAGTTRRRLIAAIPLSYANSSNGVNCPGSFVLVRDGGDTGRYPCRPTLAKGGRILDVATREPW